MSTVTVSALEAFHQFLGERLKSGRCKFSVEESVQEFRAYQRELVQLCEEIRPALERSLRGESKPFDPEKLKDRVVRVVHGARDDAGCLAADSAPFLD